MKSFFEIHGHIVECDLSADSTSLPSPQLGGFVAERPERGRNSAKTESVMSVARDTGESRTHVVDNLGRLRRTKRAMAMAVTLAAVDGPLPIGDSLAIAGLLIYSGYEIGVVTGIIEPY